MDSNIGRILMKIIDSIPMLDAQTFDTLMTNQMNVSYFQAKIINQIIYIFIQQKRIYLWSLICQTWLKHNYHSMKNWPQFKIKFLSFKFENL